MVLLLSRNLVHRGTDVATLRICSLLSLSFVSPVVVVTRALDCDHAQPRTGHQIWSQASQVK